MPSLFTANIPNERMQHGGRNVLSSFYLITINFWVLDKIKLIRMVIEIMMRLYLQIFRVHGKQILGIWSMFFAVKFDMITLHFFSNYTWKGTLNPLSLQAMKNPAKFSPFGVNVEMGVYASKCGSLWSHIAFIYKESNVMRSYNNNNNTIIM